MTGCCPSVAARLAVFAALLWGGAANAADLSVCIDKSNPASAMDHRVAEAVAKAEGVGLAIHEFDGSGDDEGFDLKNFTTLVASQCELVLGYPVDATSGKPPAGLMATAPYGRIGFVLVTPSSSRAKTLSALPKGSDVAVTYLITPNLYFVDHPNVEADIYRTDAETIATLASHKAQAAMLWRPTVVSYLIAHKNAHEFAIHELKEPHAVWNVVALYGANGTQAASQFDKTISDLRASGELGRLLEPYAVTPANPAMTPKTTTGALTLPGGIMLASADTVVPDTAAAPAKAATSLPALYTADQVAAGKQKYAADCSQCHGDDLEGLSGPALKGKTFASVKADFHVGDIFTIISQNMRATQPASLPHDDYVQIMAYVLQQNGYPSGTTKLTFDGAKASTVPLVYSGN